MKKLLTFFAGLLLAAGLASAVNAPKTSFRYTQPDGTVITLVNHGDEFYHWTTRNGVRVEQDKDGFYRTADTRRQAGLETAGRQKRSAVNAQRIGDLDRGLSSGKKRFLVILVEFDDVAFVRPDTRNSFKRMLNESGFSDNGATGSARDYYMDNSLGKFQPTFDVYGPVKLSEASTYYGKGANDENVVEGFVEACELLNGEINFAQYDQDGDGFVDNVYFIYAGHNEAEGGGINTIWPHQAIMTKSLTLDGVKVLQYACTSELSGSRGETPAGIGTFIHEFAHVLGLPDFYGPSRDIPNPEDFSPMSNGNYLNDGRTPCYFNSVERQMLGWMGDFPFVSDAGDYTLDPLAGNSLPWVIHSDIDDETFILEMRDGSGWDATLPRGMVIYHMDASDNIVSEGRTAREAWKWQAINQSKEHPCFYVVPSVDYSSSEAMIFPGSGQVHAFTPTAWSGNTLPTSLKNIRLDGDKVRFALTSASNRTLSGEVTDIAGNPVEGASVQLGVSTTSASQQIRRTRQAAANVRYKTTTAKDGSFEIFLDAGDETPVFQVSVSKSGYIEQSCDCRFGYSGRIAIVLRPAGAPSRVGLMEYDPDSNAELGKTGKGPGGDKSIMAATFFTAEELLPYSGMEIRSVTFMADVRDYRQVHAVVCTEKDVPLAVVKAGKMGSDGNFTVDLSKEKLKIEAGKGLYFGYAVDGEDEYPIVYQPLKGATLYHSYYSLTTPYWFDSSGADCALMLSVDLYDPAASKYVTLASLGFSYFENPRWKEGYSAGDTFTFQLKEAFGTEVASTTWQFDGKAVSTPSVKLESGKHTVSAHVRYADGSEEDLSLELTVR